MNRRWTPALLAAAVLGLFGCDKPYTDYEPEVTPSGPAPQVAFAPTVTVTGNALNVSYTLTNNDTSPVVVFNRIPPASPRNTAYVSVRRDGTVEVAERTFSRPPDVEAYATTDYGGPVVGPGATVEHRLSLPLPLRENRPYVDQELPDPVRKVVFCVGVARYTPGGKAPLRDGATEYVTVQQHGPSLGEQHLFCSQPVEL
ncbi:MAG TPA: hypothetical protein VFR67_31055 [Pilimelia sp.]|nr:hypothetical protein [Pilimelia sp.]